MGQDFCKDPQREFHAQLKLDDPKFQSFVFPSPSANPSANPPDSKGAPICRSQVRSEGLQDAPRPAGVPGSGAGMRCGDLDPSDTASLRLGALAEPFSQTAGV